MVSTPHPMTTPVVCALIERDGAVLCAQRGAHMRHPLQWEFPGGKVEEGELPEHALIREIQEELGVLITVLEPLTPTTHAYEENRWIRLIPFRCCLSEQSQPRASEHAAIQWVESKHLKMLQWVSADIPIVEEWQRLQNKIHHH